jgi:hypothetical protein
MENQSGRLRDTFLSRLSDYSACIQPYLRNVQEKYVAAYFVVESERIDLNQYCRAEYQAAVDAKAKLEGGSSE